MDVFLMVGFLITPIQLQLVAGSSSSLGVIDECEKCIHTGGTIRFIMKNLLIVIANSAIICSEGLIVALLGTISLRTRFQEIISRKSRLRRCHLGIDTLTRGRPGNIPMCKHHLNREILEI